MKKHIFSPLLRRTLAGALALSLALPMTALAASDDILIQSTQTIVDGLTYINTVTDHSAGRMESFTAELEEDSDVFPILLQSSGTVYGGATINKAVEQAKNLGYRVYAAINTDYFSTTTGVPMGIVIEDGVYKSDAAGNPAMVIVDNEVSLCPEPEVSLTLLNKTTDKEITPNYFNKYRSATGGVYLYNEDFSSVSTRSTGEGWFVRMEQVDNDLEHLTVNSTIKLEVTEVFRSAEAQVIGEGEYILTAADTSNKGSVFESFAVGDRITLKTECEDDDLSEAQWAGGVGDTLINKGKKTDRDDWKYPDKIRAPRTALGMRRDGTLVLYAVDGRQSNHSAGLTLEELADEMLDLDCRWAVNLDGGGSTTISLWLPGASGAAMQNSPSDGKARSCATYLLLVSEEEGDERPDRLVMKENGLTVLAGSSVTLPEVLVVDEALNVLDEDVDDLTITSKRGLGEIEDGVYTADTRSGTDILRLRSRELDVSGEVEIHVVDELTELTVTADGGKEALTRLSLFPGDSANLTVTGSYWGRTALRAPVGVTFTLDKSVGQVDENGLLTLADSPKSGDLIVSAGGLETTIPVVIRNLHLDVPEGHWAYNAVEYCYEKGIVSGISSTEFGATGLIRRADFMLMLYAALGRPSVTTPCTFTDVSESDYYYTAMAWAQKVGLISGAGNGMSLATAPITREQAFTILRQALPLLNEQVPNAPLTYLDQFSDKDQIADYAKAHTATLVAQGIVSGKGTGIDPKGNLTRAEMAALLHKISTYDPIQKYSEVEAPAAPEAPAVPETPVTPEVPEPPVSPELPETPTSPELGKFPLEVLPEGTATGTVTDAEVGLNVRSGPGTDHEIQQKIANGANVIVIGRPEDWYRILYLNEEGVMTEGYVSANYVTLASRPGTIVDAEVGLNVRSGPGTEHEIQQKIANGTHVIVLKELEGWCRIAYLNEEGALVQGYASADYVAIDS